MKNRGKIAVLFVCMGNICRSPMAEGVFADRVRRLGFGDRIGHDSAGTHDFNVGSPADPRARCTLERRNINIGSHRARQVTFSDFEKFDYIVAMDAENYATLRVRCGSKWRKKLYLLLDFAPDLDQREIPDPYLSGETGFDEVAGLIERGTQGFLDYLRKRHFA